LRIASSSSARSRIVSSAFFSAGVRSDGATRASWSASGVAWELRKRAELVYVAIVLATSRVDVMAAFSFVGGLASVNAARFGRGAKAVACEVSFFGAPRVLAGELPEIAIELRSVDADTP